MYSTPPSARILPGRRGSDSRVTLRPPVARGLRANLNNLTSPLRLDWAGVAVGNCGPPYNVDEAGMPCRLDSRTGSMLLRRRVFSLRGYAGEGHHNRRNTGSIRLGGNDAGQEHVTGDRGVNEQTGFTNCRGRIHSEWSAGICEGSV